MGFRRRCHSENGGLKRRDKVAGCPGEFPIPATIYSIAAAAFLQGARAAPPVGESRFGVGARAPGRGGDRKVLPPLDGPPRRLVHRQAGPVRRVGEQRAQQLVVDARADTAPRARSEKRRGGKE